VAIVLSLLSLWLAREPLEARRFAAQRNGPAEPKEQGAVGPRFPRAPPARFNPGFNATFNGVHVSKLAHRPAPRYRAQK
jgi:hypothetical protein